MTQCDCDYINQALASDPGDVYRVQSTSELASKAVIEDFALTLCAGAGLQ